jgi:predicted PurR-regulated permease PerM
MDTRSHSLAVARTALIATAVSVAVVVFALALWKLRVILALLLFGFTIAAAMRPGVDRLAVWRIPRSVGVLLHYVVLVGLVALFLSFIVPTLSSEVQNAVHTVRDAKGNAPDGSFKARVLDDLARHLQHLPSTDELVRRSVSIGAEAVKVLVGVLFSLAVAAYWIFERDRTVELVARIFPRSQRQTFRDTWTLIDQKLGAFVRGQLLLIAFVSVVASLAFFLVDEPYWLLIGISTGILEVVPVIGPLAALGLAVVVGLTVSWHVALFAGIALLAIRLFEDYMVTPRVLGGAVGLPPLLTLISVSATGILLGGFYILLAIPIASLLATIVDVTLRGVDPAEVDVPTVIFPAQDTASSGR